MRVLSSRLDLAAFYARLASESPRLLMLDYDGTLAPFKIRPEQAVPYPGVTDLLGALCGQRDTRIVIVSGRRAAEVAALLPLEPRPEIWGAHGWERMPPGGEVHLEEPDPALEAALRKAATRAGELERMGARLEHKPASIALHWRGLPALKVARLRERALAAWRPLAGGATLELLPFDGGLELRARGSNKQHVVKAVLSGTAPETVVAYLGDDLTDEDAFRAVKAQGLAVLVRPQFRETEADIWIRPPRELLQFIRRWVRGSGKK